MPPFLCFLLITFTLVVSPFCKSSVLPILTTDTIRNYPFPLKDSIALPFNYENVKDYIFAHLHYPPEAVRKKIEGTVWVKFTVTLSGKTDSVYLTRSADSLLDTEALRLIRNMPRWKPLSTQGIFTPLTYEIPVIFELIEDK